nr:MAG TPA: hypothetical protein [Caudoviricetes sp.]
MLRLAFANHIVLRSCFFGKHLKYFLQIRQIF